MHPGTFRSMKNSQNMEHEHEAHKPRQTHLLFIRKKKHDEIPKGFGSFRPVVKWHEISLHRKKVADKRILACILGVGAMLVFMGIVLLLLGLFVLSRQCPFEWIPIDNRCLYLSSHNMTWPLARDFCLEQGHMVDIANDDENIEITDLLKGPTWIGLFRSRQKASFEWSSGMEFSFDKWSSVPPTSPPSFTQCVKINSDSGLWTAENNCTQRLYAACEYHKVYYPVVLVGPVLIVCGIIVMVLSIEVCHRHRLLLQKSKSLIDEEEIPDVDKRFEKKSVSAAVSSVIQDSRPTSSILRKKNANKTYPADSSVQYEKKSPSRVSFEDEPEEKSPNDSVRTFSSAASPSVPLISAPTKSQEMLELMLSPKNL